MQKKYSVHATPKHGDVVSVYFDPHKESTTINLSSFRKTVVLIIVIIVMILNIVWLVFLLKFRNNATAQRGAAVLAGVDAISSVGNDAVVWAFQ